MKKQIQIDIFKHWPSYYNLDPAPFKIINASYGYLPNLSIIGGFKLRLSRPFPQTISTQPRTSS